MDHSFGAVVYRRADTSFEYLLVLHAWGRHWDFPKGHPDDGESPEETALREVREETGWEIGLLPPFREVIGYTLPGGEEKRVDLFLGKALKKFPGTPDPDEIALTQWCPYEKARARLTYDNSREILDKAESFLNDH